MTTTYSFICPATKKSIWAGQSSGNAQPRLYDDDAIAQFLAAHKGKPLLFVDDYWLSEQPDIYEEWKPTAPAAITEGKSDE